jgi:5-methylcytosine-specific restriction endonuclease McrA
MKRESLPEHRRLKPSLAICDRILENQDHRCFYCARRFGSRVRSGRRTVSLKLNWDHLVPFSYAQNNQTENFVAACHRCNAWKGSLVFQTLEDAQVYLLNKWEEDLNDVD